MIQSTIETKTLSRQDGTTFETYSVHFTNTHGAFDKYCDTIEQARKWVQVVRKALTTGR